MHTHNNVRLPTAHPRILKTNLAPRQRPFAVWFSIMRHALHLQKQLRTYTPTAKRAIIREPSLLGLVPTSPNESIYHRGATLATHGFTGCLVLPPNTTQAELYQSHFLSLLPNNLPGTG